MFEWLWSKQRATEKVETPPLRHGRDPKVYISYRRSDYTGVAGRLYDRLSAELGGENIFMDVEMIAPGTDFVAAIKQEIQFADIFLVLMGPAWSTTVNEKGLRRIEDAHDFVSLEIRFALEARKPLIPVLVDGAQMPTAGDLPEPLRNLTRYNVFSLNHETFRRDTEQLVKQIRQLIERHASEIEVTPSGPKSVFVSHSTSDRYWVENEIVGFLSDNKIKPWYSADAILTAAQWEREILKGMEACDWFSVVVSPAAAESDWVKDELFWAMQNRPTRIVPIIMTKCDLYKFHIRLARIQHVDFTTGRTVARQKLLAVFGQSD
jgi:hypothetical protein